MITFSDLTNRLSRIKYHFDSKYQIHPILEEKLSEEDKEELIDSVSRYDEELNVFADAIRNWINEDYDKLIQKGIILGGPPGIGKTHTLRQVLYRLINEGLINNTKASIDGEEDPKYGVQGIRKYLLEHINEKGYFEDSALDWAYEHAQLPSYYKGSITPISLYVTGFFNRKPNTIVIFDDCDRVFDDSNCLNTLKALTDTTTIDDEGGRLVAINSPHINNRDRNPFKDFGINVPSSYTFKGRVICITNKLAIDEDEHLSAVLDRCHFHAMKLDKKDMYWKIMSIVANQYEKNDNDTVKDVIIDCIDWMLKYKEEILNMPRLSLRFAKKITSSAVFFHGHDFEERFFEAMNLAVKEDQIHGD